MRTGFPLQQLRLHILLRRAPRFLPLGTAVSDETLVDENMLPGDGRAATFLELALLQPLDRARAVRRPVAPSGAVDDIILHRVGTVAMVTRELAKAAEEL